jgi:hypothetical protein
MKIKFVSGPRKGEEGHAPRSQETQLLVDAGIIEIFPELTWQHSHDPDYWIKNRLAQSAGRCSTSGRR